MTLIFEPAASTVGEAVLERRAANPRAAVRPGNPGSMPWTLGRALYARLLHRRLERVGLDGLLRAGEVDDPDLDDEGVGVVGRS
jgi:hypothetical protein